MVKVTFPNEESSKYDIQTFLKKYKIKYSTFQTTDELLDLIQENKKLIFDIEKQIKKEARELREAKKLNNNQNTSTISISTSASTSSTSSFSSFSSSFSSPSKPTKSLESPFKKKLSLKQNTGDLGDLSVNSDKIIYQKKSIKPVNLKNKIVNNTLYVFVSSTFKDMCGERDHLIKNIFPALNVKAKTKNLQIVPIDLRWGLTKEETTVKGQIELCLKQIDKCPIMVTMLGNRFGWVPKEYKFLDAEEGDKDSTSKWLESLPLGQSITSIEVQYALSKISEKHSIALFRDPTFQEKVPILHQNSFSSDSAESAKELENLKKKIISHPTCSVMENYPCRYSGTDKDGNPFTSQLELFGKFVFDQIWEIIELEFPNPIALLDSYAQENIYHKNYLELKGSKYFAREAIQKKLKDHVFDTTSIDKIGIIYGEPGSGKSSSLAFLATQLQSNKNCIVLYHFVGCSGESTDVTNALYRFCKQLNDQLNLKLELSDNHEKLRILFGEILKSKFNDKGGRKLIIIIDGLDEFSTSNQTHQMEWLPESNEIGKSIYILLSCDHGKLCWDSLHLRNQIPQTFYLTPLEMSERQIITTKTLEFYSKKLEQKLMDKLIGKTHAKFPLFIILACEELRISGSFDKLSVFINKIPDTIEALINLMITRLEGDLGKDLIKKSLSYIALSRFGLSEGELVDLLREKNKPPLAFHIWAPLLHSINALLKHTSGDNSLSFFHNEINKVIIKKYMPLEKSQITVQNHISDYYWKLSDPDSNKTWTGTQLKPFVELVHHLVKGKRWDLISTLLQDLSFVETKFRIGLGRDLIENYLLGINEILAPSLSGERWTGYNYSSVVNVEDFYAFIQYQQHQLYKYPHITYQQAFNLPDDSICHKISDKYLDAKKLPFIKWVNKLQMTDFVIQTLAGHEDFVRCSLYKEDGSLIASCADDKTIRIWNGETGQLVRVFPKGVHLDKVTNLQWRGNTVVTCSRDKKVILWDEFGKVIHQFAGHTGPVWGVSVSGDKKRIVSASWDYSAIVWDVESKQKVVSLQGHGNNKLSACAYSHSNKIIATGCWGGFIVIWDAVTFKQLTKFKITDSTILYLSFSHDDTFLSVSCVDTFTHIVKCSTWSRLASLEGHTEAVISSRFSSDSKYIVSCSDDKSVRIYDTSDWNQVTVMTGHSGRIISAAFHPSNTKRRVITGATDKFIKIWDPKLNQIGSTTQPHQGHKKSVKYLHYDKVNDRLFSVSDDKTIGIWKDFSKSDLLNPSTPIALPVERLHFTNDSTFIAISESKTKKVFVDANSHQPNIMELSKDFLHSSNVPAFAISPKDPTLMAFINKGNLVIAHTYNLSIEIDRLAPPFVLTQCKFHPSGDYIACHNNTGWVIYKVNNSGHWTMLTSYPFPDGSPIVQSIEWGQNYFAVGNANGSIYLYDIKRSFCLITKIDGHSFGIHGMAFSPNDNYLFSASLDKQSILWDLSTFKVISVFPLASISTSNILFYYDLFDQLSVVLSDYTGKIHNLKLLNLK